jgi:xanthine dehydrogenase accessory factor
MRKIYLHLAGLELSHSPVALGTITAVTGSAPGKPGSSAIFGNSGLIAGTIGGGSIEGKVSKITLDAMMSKKSGIYRFDFDNYPAGEDDPICGGSATVLVDGSPLDHIEVFTQIKDSLGKRIPGVLVTTAEGKEKDLKIRRFWVAKDEKSILPEYLDTNPENLINELIRSGKQGDLIEADNKITGKETMLHIFLEPVFPRKHLVIAGAGHIGRALAKLGKFLDFEITVIDDRPEYANPENIPDADNLIVENIGKAMDKIDKTPDTYVVIVTRGHKDDAAALKPCFGSVLGYIGMIGSRKKVSRMREDFLNNGWATPDQWDKIYSPVGIGINSRTVEEIAVSIAAQLVLVRNTIAIHG